VLAFAQWPVLNQQKVAGSYLLKEGNEDDYMNYEWIYYLDHWAILPDILSFSSTSFCFFVFVFSFVFLLKRISQTLTSGYLFQVK
jgi:hypothetical protein